jgi:hypothetical protein
MMFTQAICVLIAPAAVYAAAFPWALPEPTIFAPAPDNWSPAPTAAPQLSAFLLFKRQTNSGDNTCGFVSGSSRTSSTLRKHNPSNNVTESSITCPNTSVCATNTLNGVHGCCDPKSLDACTIPTTCIPSIGFSTLCTDALCSTNAAILKCTEAAAPACFKWLITYSKTVMTQHGCASQAFTSSAQRSWGVQTSIPPELYRTATMTVAVTPTATASFVQSDNGKAEQPLAAIIGGTVGACIAIALLVLAIIILHRRRAKRNVAPKAQYHGPVTAFDPNNMLETSDAKIWQQRAGPLSRSSDAMPQYPGMGTARYGVVEVEGVQRAVEVDGRGLGQKRVELH